MRRLLTQGDYDWLHVATHGGFFEDQTEARSGIRLEDGDLLRPEDLVGPAIEGHIGNAWPGFFFNTCHGGRQGWALTRLGGWANRLIGAGAGLFIAPLWTVDGALAMKFADTFYGRILADQTVAAAGQQARAAVHEAGDPTWLAYSIYAHPNARVVCSRSLAAAILGPSRRHMSRPHVSATPRSCDSKRSSTRAFTPRSIWPRVGD